MFTGTARAQGTPGIKTDRAVYPEPSLPSLPAAGGKFTDPVFGTQIMRATDANDYTAPGCSTWYSQWPTFNSDMTRILIRCGDSGDMIIKAFDPVNFTLGTTLRKTFGGGATQIPTIGGEYARWEGATWSRNDPDKIWVVPLAPNTGGSTNKGPQIYTYSVSANAYTPVKSFVSLFAAGQQFFEYHFAGTASDGDYDVFTASVIPEQNDEAARWFAWQRTGDRGLFNFDNANVTHYNNCNPSKGGDYIYCGPDVGYHTRKLYRVSDLAEQDISSAPASAHGDMGTVWNVARNVQGSNMPQERRTISDWNNTALAIFDWKDGGGVQDQSNDCHTSLAADNEDWVMEGCYDDPAYNTPGYAYETGAFEDEIMQISMDGSQRIQRLLHHRSSIKNTTATNGYWAVPKPTITRDGRFIAFTSNWEDSIGRYDLFIAKIDPPSATPSPTPTGSPVDVIWTNLVNASASGSSLTATAADGRGESTQSITSGNGSVKVTITNMGETGYTYVGLMNGSFTGNSAEIDYGWFIYNGLANCRMNGDAITSLISTASGDTFEVKINGTTVEWYRNNVFVWSVSGQTLVYPYRVAVKLSEATSPKITNTQLTGTN